VSSDVNAPAGFDPWPDAQVHVEWGTLGAELAASRGDIVVIVDVLSFSTTITIATARDFTCLVYSGAEIEAMGGLTRAGEQLGARPLSKRRRVPPGEISLSPSSLLAAEPGQRVLFTSLNGAAVAAASTKSPAVLVGGLRNARACAEEVSRLLKDGAAGRVTVVACGEHWSSVEPAVEGLRPSLEDWLGAGLICERLAALGLRLSAEANVAATAWTASGGLPALRTCVSARELEAAGFADDVALALEVDADDQVPVRSDADRTGRVFVPADYGPHRPTPSADLPGQRPDQPDLPLAEIAVELADRGLIPASCRAAYVTGSRVRGWGNADSDLDVVVLTDGRQPDPGIGLSAIGRGANVIHATSVTVAGITCDIEYWPEKQVGALLSRASWQQFGVKAQERQFMIYEINFLDRLGYAVAISEPERLRYWQEQLRTSAFRAMRAKYWLHEAEHFVEDARGQLAGGDAHSATLSARLAFGCAVDALLARYGQLSQNGKWRARRLLAADPPELSFAQYWNTETMAGLDRDDPRQWIESVAVQAAELCDRTRTWLDERRTNAPEAEA
jgi:2-phosphosulfolactate phosphatase